MVSDTLEIAAGLSLDADYLAGAAVALLGKRNSGKTHTCRVLAEELFAARVQTVIVDPMGVFWGLRSSATGDKDGLPIPVFGGEHGDAPLEPSAGALMADLVVGEGLSMILDLSGFDSRAQERTFAAAFLDRLYRTNRDLVHLIVDEADLFAPQKPRGDDTRLLVTMENIVRRGRNHGIGITMASQRPAVLHKDVLTQIDALVAMRLVAPQDRDAIRDWVRAQGDEESWSEIAPSLPKLAGGECWWWIPEQSVLRQVQVRRTRTFDSSPTRRRGHSNRVPKTFADVDLEAISGRIAATLERAKAIDPRELGKRIHELEKELAAAESATPAPDFRREVIEVSVLDEALVARLESAVDSLGRSQSAVAEVTSDLLDRVRSATEESASSVADVARLAASITAALASARNQLEPANGKAPQAGTSMPERPALQPRITRSPVAATTVAAGDDTALSPARRRLLEALASLEGIGITMARKTQLALWAGVSPKSSGFANNLGALRTAGLIDYPAPSHVGLTDEGRATAGPAEALVSNHELHLKVQGLVSPARWRILAALIESYPDALSKDELADAAGVSASSSGYANNLGALRTLGLLDYPAPGQVASTDILFIDGV